MKIFRYRKPSLRTMMGYTKYNRRLRRSLGISQIQAVTKPSRIKQRYKYRLGLYSPVARVVRNASKGKYPSFLGLFKK